MAFAREFKKNVPDLPLIAVPSTYSEVYENQLQEAGFKIVIYANHLLRASYPAMVKAAELVLENERAKEADEICMKISEILTLVP